jgi:hypothetical protein
MPAKAGEARATKETKNPGPILVVPKDEVRKEAIRFPKGQHFAFIQISRDPKMESGARSRLKAALTQGDQFQNGIFCLFMSYLI